MQGNVDRFLSHPLGKPARLPADQEEDQTSAADLDWSGLSGMDVAALQRSLEEARRG
jgi:hypothetical protein